MLGYAGHSVVARDDGLRNHCGGVEALRGIDFEIHQGWADRFLCGRK